LHPNAFGNRLFPETAGTKTAIINEALPHSRYSKTEDGKATRLPRQNHVYGPLQNWHTTFSTHHASDTIVFFGMKKPPTRVSFNVQCGIASGEIDVIRSSSRIVASTNGSLHRNAKKNHSHINKIQQKLLVANATKHSDGLIWI